MRPDDQREQLGAFVDAELDVERQLEIESRLSGDAAARREVEALRRLREDIRGAASYHRAPAGLRRRVRALAGVADAAAPADAGGRLRRWLAWRPAVLALGVSSLLAGGIALNLQSTAHDERVAQDVIASHVRATLSQRLVDVASSDQHTVKPWLSARLDFSPPVYALQAQGVVFQGGRVDYVDGHPVAVLVYKRREHVIDAFLWPSGGDQALQGLAQRGFNVEHGAHAGMAFWLVSDLNRDELATLARAFEQPGNAP